MLRGSDESGTCPGRFRIISPSLSSSSSSFSSDSSPSSPLGGVEGLRGRFLRVPQDLRAGCHGVGRVPPLHAPTQYIDTQASTSLLALFTHTSAPSLNRHSGSRSQTLLLIFRIAFGNAKTMLEAVHNRDEGGLQVSVHNPDKGVVHSPSTWRLCQAAEQKEPRRALPRAGR